MIFLDRIKSLSLLLSKQFDSYVLRGTNCASEEIVYNFDEFSRPFSLHFEATDFVNY